HLVVPICPSCSLAGVPTGQEICGSVGSAGQIHGPNRALTRFRRNALIQRMAEEESGAWGCVDTRDVIVRLTGQQTNHATSKLLVSSSSSMLTLDRICEVSVTYQTYFSVTTTVLSDSTVSISR